MNVTLKPGFLLGIIQRADNGQIKGSWLSLLPFDRIRIKDWILWPIIGFGLVISGCSNPAASSEKIPDFIGDWFLASETINEEKVDSIPQLQWTFLEDGTMNESSCNIGVCTFRNYDWAATEDSLSLTLSGVSQRTWKYDLDGNWLKIFYSASHNREFERIEMN